MRLFIILALACLLLVKGATEEKMLNGRNSREVSTSPQQQHVSRSALESIQNREILQKMYKLEPSACESMGGIPLVIGLLREEEKAQLEDKSQGKSGGNNGWGGAYYTMSFLDSSSSALGSSTTKLETGTFSLRPRHISTETESTNLALTDSIDTRTVCLRKDMQYVFQMSRNPNEGEIGAVVGKADFLGPQDSLHITTWDGVYKSRVRRHLSGFQLEKTWKSLYYYAPGRAPPTVSPTPYPTWSRAPSPKPTTIRATAQSLSCLETIPGYSTNWVLADYCKFYASTGCTSSSIGGFSCVPSYMKSQSEGASCGATFCDIFSILSNVCVSGVKASYNFTNKHNLAYRKTHDQCFDAFESVVYNTSQLVHVNWRVSMTMQGAHSTRIAADKNAKGAIKAALCEFLPGVTMTKVAFETVDSLSITRSPTKSPSSPRASQKTPSPSPPPTQRTALRAPSQPPTAHPTYSLVPTKSPSPTPLPTSRRGFRTRAPSTDIPTPAPTFPRNSDLNSTGVVVTLTVTSSIQAMGYVDEQTAFEEATANVQNAAASNALSFALREQSSHFNATSIACAVVLKRNVVVTSLGTLPPSSTPISDSANTENAGVIAGSTAAAVAGVGMGGAAAYQAYKVFGNAKELVQVLPADQLQAIEGVVPLKF